MEAQQLVDSYVEICRVLKDTLDAATRKAERRRAICQYLIALHDLQYSAVRGSRDAVLDEGLKPLWTSMSNSVDKLLQPSLLKWGKAIARERTFFPFNSADDDDFVSKLAHRCGQCIDDVGEADGVEEKADAVRECLEDLHEIIWGEIEQEPP